MSTPKPSVDMDFDSKNLRKGAADADRRNTFQVERGNKGKKSNLSDTKGIE